MEGGGVLAVLGDDSFAYRLVFLLHVLAVIIGFGSTFVYPIMGREASKRQGVEAKALSEVANESDRIMTHPVIYLVGVFGLLLVLMSDAIGFDEAWVGLSIALYLVALAFALLVHRPNLRRIEVLSRELATMGPPREGATTAPPPQVAEVEERGRKAGMYGGLLHLAFVIILILMIWKPGSPFT